MADWGASCVEVVKEGYTERRAHGIFTFKRWKQHWTRVTLKAITLTTSKDERGIEPKKHFVVNSALKVRHEPYRVRIFAINSLCYRRS